MGYKNFIAVKYFPRTSSHSLPDQPISHIVKWALVIVVRIKIEAQETASAIIRIPTSKSSREIVHEL